MDIKREKRQIRFMRENNKKNLRAVIILTICVCLLIVNNILTYKNLGYLEQNKQLIIQDSSLTAQKKPETVQQENKIAAAGKVEINSIADKLLAEKESNKLNEKLEKLIKEKEQLKKLNEELVEDNISLQNSLKLAAAVGIKPRNYENPPRISSRSGIRTEQYLGKFKGTAYTPSKAECGNSKGITASGKPIVPGTTIAVDTRYWPIGTVFYIKGIGYVTAMDTGSAVKGKNRFDFAVFDKKFALALGTREWDVYLIKKGNGKVDLDFIKNLGLTDSTN